MEDVDGRHVEVELAGRGALVEVDRDTPGRAAYPGGHGHLTGADLAKDRGELHGWRAVRGEGLPHHRDRGGPCTRREAGGDRGIGATGAALRTCAALPPDGMAHEPATLWPLGTSSVAGSRVTDGPASDAMKAAFPHHLHLEMVGPEAAAESIAEMVRDPTREGSPYCRCLGAWMAMDLTLPWTNNTPVSFVSFFSAVEEKAPEDMRVRDDAAAPIPLLAASHAEDSKERLKTCADISAESSCGP